MNGIFPAHAELISREQLLGTIHESHPVSMVQVDWRFDDFPDSTRSEDHIAMDEYIIYGLCISEVSGWAWSSDRTQFATIIGDEQAPVVVVDMVEWQPYIVAHHIGHILFWRSIDRSR